MAVSAHRPWYRILAGDNQTLSSLMAGGPSPGVTAEKYMTHGTGSGYADVVYYTQYTIGASGTQSVDFSTGLTETDGTTATPIRLKFLAVLKVSGTGTFSVSRPAANGIALFAAASDESGTFTDAGSGLVFPLGDTGITITAGTGDLMTITEKGGAAAVVVEVFAICATA